METQAGEFSQVFYQPGTSTPWGYAGRRGLLESFRNRRKHLVMQLITNAIHNSNDSHGVGGRT